MHNYLVQDLSARMWVVPAQFVDEFIRLAEVKGPHQDALDELSLSRQEQESIGDELTGDNLWVLNSAAEDYPVSWRYLPETVISALMLEPVNPAEIDALRRSSIRPGVISAPTRVPVHPAWSGRVRLYPNERRGWTGLCGR